MKIFDHAKHYLFTSAWNKQLYEKERVGQSNGLLPSHLN